MYTTVEIPIADRVPFGISLEGFLKSPEILAPAIIPVTAGKKMASTDQKSYPPEYPGCRFSKKLPLVQPSGEMTCTPSSPSTSLYSEPEKNRIMAHTINTNNPKLALITYFKPTMASN